MAGKKAVREGNREEDARRASRTAKKLAVILVCFMMSFTLSGCAVTSSDVPELLRSIFLYGEVPISGPVEEVTGNVGDDGLEHSTIYPSDGGLSELDVSTMRPQGSAQYLKGDVILIGVYVEDSADQWTDQDIDLVQSNMSIAVDWLEEQAEDNGIDLTIHFGEDNSIFECRSSILEDNTDTQNAARYLNNLDIDWLKEKYNTDNVGYLLFIHEDEGSYTWPYTRSGGTIDRYYYNEFCSLFLYDGTGTACYDNPATYAHEIMHLFGAEDLYTATVSDGVTQEVVDYVAENYPDEIMYYTYEDDNTSNYQEITKMMSPFTLYYLGWNDETEFLKNWPSIDRTNTASFE